MAKRTIRNLLHVNRKGERKEEQALSPEMRSLMSSFEADYGHHRVPKEASTSGHQEPRVSAGR